MCSPKSIILVDFIIPIWLSSSDSASKVTTDCWYTNSCQMVAWRIICLEVRIILSLPSAGGDKTKCCFAKPNFFWFSAQEGALPWAKRMKIAVQAAQGLCFLHDSKSQVIYRDFKASNILLDPVCVCVLLITTLFPPASLNLLTLAYYNNNTCAGIQCKAVGFRVGKNRSDRRSITRYYCCYGNGRLCWPRVYKNRWSIFFFLVWQCIFIFNISNCSFGCQGDWAQSVMYTALE